MTGQSTPVVVEVVGLSVCDGRLHWTLRRAALSGSAKPDVLARELAELTREPAPGVVLHSTSWRHTGRDLVLTYALFPGPAAAGGRHLEHHVVTGPGPLHPTPTHVGDRHVAAHAARHLADLATGRDPHVVACVQQRPGDWQLLAEHAVQVHVDHPTAPPDAPHAGAARSPAAPHSWQ